MKARTNAEVISIKGGISNEKYGAIDSAFNEFKVAIDDVLSAIKGKEKLVVKYEKKPEIIVDVYAINTVIPSNFPAPFPNSAIPGATNPIIISGITKDRYLLNIDVNVTTPLTISFGKK
jgi:hypothetical protein